MTWAVERHYTVVIMANPAKQLYDLQEVDLELSGKCARVQAIEGQLVESEALLAARDEVARAEALLAEMRKRQRDEEAEAADIGGKVKTLEARLYGGSIKNSKELAGIQAEADRLKGVKRSHEDAAIDIMMQAETAASALGAAREKLAGVEQEWARDQTRLLQEKGELTVQVEALERQRGVLRVDIPAPPLELYDALLGAKQGRAVARVERGTCQGCRINLPMSDIQRSRLGQELVRCSNCGRILFVS